MNTYKISLRVNARSPKYKALFARSILQTGTRLDIPFMSFAKFRIEKTIKNKWNGLPTQVTRSGICLIIENNRTRKTTVFRLSSRVK